MKPLKRIEHFLAKIAGDSSAKELSPKTRDEYYLNEIAENGGGGGSSGKFDTIECERLVLEIPNESSVNMTPDTISELGSCVVFEGDSGGQVFLNNIHDPISDQQAATKKYVDSVAGGGSEPFVVTFSGTTDDGDAACDKTWAEVTTAYSAGKRIVFRYAYTDEDEILYWYLPEIMFITEDEGLIEIGANYTSATAGPIGYVAIMYIDVQFDSELVQVLIQNVSVAITEISH